MYDTKKVIASRCFGIRYDSGKVVSQGFTLIGVAAWKESHIHRALKRILALQHEDLTPINKTCASRMHDTSALHTSL